MEFLKKLVILSSKNQYFLLVLETFLFIIGRLLFKATLGHIKIPHTSIFIESYNRFVFSTVGGDINVNGGDSGRGNGGNGQWGGEEEEGGDDSFEDGCSVVGSTVHECDGTQRLLTKVEKKKVVSFLLKSTTF